MATRKIIPLVLGLLISLQACKNNASNVETANTRDSLQTVPPDTPAAVLDTEATTMTPDSPLSNDSLTMIKRTKPGIYKMKKKKNLPDTYILPRTASKPDTSRSTTEENVQKRSAVLGYSYFKKMQRGETKSIHAYIMVNNPTSKVIDTLRTITLSEDAQPTNDTSSIFTQNMGIYRYVELSLISDSNDFNIQAIHPSSRQEIDNTLGNHWEWTVKPITDKAEASLTLIAIPEKPDGTKDRFESKRIHIRVIIQPKTFLRKLSIWIYDNMGIVITALVIPLILILAKRFWGGKNA